MTEREKGMQVGDTFNLPAAIHDYVGLKRENMHSITAMVEVLAMRRSEHNNALWLTIREALPDLGEWELALDTDTKTVTLLRKLDE